MMTARNLLAVLAVSWAVAARAGLVDVTTLGVKNDGSADVSALINEATKTDALYLPPGVYKVEKPLKLRNSLCGAGFARVPKTDATRTWLVSAIPDGAESAGVIEFADNTCATVENLSTLTMGDYCRPVDHGSLRDMNGRVRYRECLPADTQEEF